MNTSYLNGWVYGKRHSDYQHTLYNPTRGMISSSSIDPMNLIENTNPPTANNDISTQLVFLQGKTKGFLYNIPSGEELNGDFPMLNGDPMNGLAWCVQDGKNNTIHVTKGELSRSQGTYSEIGNRIAGKVGGECIGSFTYPDFLKKCKTYNKTVNSFIDWPRDNKVFHTLDGKRSITPEEMETMLPAMFWVRVGGKTEHRIHLVVADDMPMRHDWNNYIRSRNPEYTGTPIWTMDKVRSYYTEHKDEEQSLFSRVKNWFSRHKSALKMSAIVTGLTAAGLGLFHNRESIGEALGKLGAKAKDMISDAATGAAKAAGEVAGKAIAGAKAIGEGAKDLATNIGTKAKDMASSLGTNAKDLYTKGREAIYGKETVASQWMDDLKKPRDPSFVQRDNNNLANGTNLIDDIDDVGTKLNLMIDNTMLESYFIGSILQGVLTDGKFDEQRLYKIPNLSFGQVRKLLDMLFPDWTFTDRFFARVFCASSWWCLTSKMTKGWMDSAKDFVYNAWNGTKKAASTVGNVVSDATVNAVNAMGSGLSDIGNAMASVGTPKPTYVPTCTNNSVLFTWYPRNADNNWNLFKRYLRSIRKQFKLPDKCVYMDDEFHWGDHPSKAFLEKREKLLRQDYSFGGRLYNLVDNVAGKEIADLVSTGKEAIYNKAKSKLVDINNDAKMALTDKDTALQTKLLKNDLSIQNAQKDLDVGVMSNKKAVSDANANLQTGRMKNWSNIAVGGMNMVGDTINGATDMVGGVFTNANTNLKKVFDSEANAIKSGYSVPIEAFKGIGNVGGALLGSGSQIVKGVGDLGETVFDSGSRIVNGGTNLVTDAGNFVTAFNGLPKIGDSVTPEQVAAAISASRQGSRRSGSRPIIINMSSKKGKGKKSSRNRREAFRRKVDEEKRRRRLASQVVDQIEQQGLNQEQADQLINNVAAEEEERRRRERHRFRPLSRRDQELGSTEPGSTEITIDSDDLYSDEYDDD